MTEPRRKDVPVYVYGIGYKTRKDVKEVGPFDVTVVIGRAFHDGAGWRTILHKPWTIGGYYNFLMPSIPDGDITAKHPDKGEVQAFFFRSNIGVSSSPRVDTKAGRGK